LLRDIDKLRETASEDVIALNPELFGAAPCERPAKQNKFNARKTEVNGHTFDSKGEAQRYRELALLERSGLIKDLQLQVNYVLQEGFEDADGVKQRAITYTADFTYVQDGITIIEDYKSKATAKGEAFRIRWRLLAEKFKNDPTVKCQLTGV
jgi:hypothetical protein